MIVLAIIFSSIILPMSFAFADVENEGTYVLQPPKVTQAIPDWVKTQFEWFVDGQIDEATLLTSMNWMFDNNLMHLSEEAAKEVNQLREVNTRLHQGVSSYIQKGQISEEEFEVLTGVDVEPVPASAIPNLLDARKSGNENQSSGFTGGVSVASGDINNLTSEQALQYLQKTYNLNPNLKTMIIQQDENHDKWISVLSIDWHSTSGPSVVLSPTATLAETFVFSHLLESANSSSSSGLSSNSTITFTGLEFAGPTVDSIMKKGGTTSDWEEGIAAFSSQGMSESVTEDLQRIVVLCNTEIDTKTQQIDSELELIEQWLKIIEENQETSSYDAAGRLTSTTGTTQNNQSELDFIGKKLSVIDQRIRALSNGVEVLDGKVQGMDDSDATNQASVDMILKGKKILQNLVEEQKRQLEELAEKSRTQHDIAMNAIRNMK